MRVSILLSALVLMSCGGPTVNKEQHAAGPDSQTVAPAANTAVNKIIKKDSTDGDDGNPEPSLEEIMAEYQQRCRDTVRVDTQVFYLGKDYRIQLRHYCTNDSLLELPKGILDIYKLKKFTTSNFVSSLVVRSRDSVLLDTIIRRDLFYRYADPSLRTYGVLFYGGSEFLPGRLNIDYSWSIPLSDVGIGVHLSYAFGGGLITIRSEPEP